MTGFRIALVTGANRGIGAAIAAQLVADGFTETDMSDAMDDKAKEIGLSMIPAGRFAQPDEIAAVGAFLASERAGYITGNVLRRRSRNGLLSPPPTRRGPRRHGPALEGTRTPESPPPGFRPGGFASPPAPGRRRTGARSGSAMVHPRSRPCARPYALATTPTRARCGDT